MMTFVGGGRIGMIGSMGAPGGPLVYVPDLAPVGSKDSYFPRSVEQDARALVFLGFLSDLEDANRAESTGSQGGDMANEAGAWDPSFRGAVTRFQSTQGITADSWIGPQTRTFLARAVAVKNANPGALPIPAPPGTVPPVLVQPGGVPAKPAVLPGVRPASSSSSDDTMMYVGIGAGVLVLGGLAWYALK
jgi:hypothetical protein